MDGYFWSVNADRDAWVKAPAIEFTAEAHELVPLIVNFWLDVTDYVNAEGEVTGRAQRDEDGYMASLATITLSADGAERIGNQLLAAAAASRLTKEY